MNPTVEQAADNLVARRNGGRATPLPALSEEDAYRVQARVLDLLGETVAGWKVAVVGGKPVAAPVPGTALVRSGATLVRDGGGWKVETELGFRLGRDLPRGGAPYGRDDILAAVESVHACFEIVGPRVPEPPTSPFPVFLADNLGCAHVVVAAGVPFQALPEEGVLHIDGARAAAGPHPHGDPLATLLGWANAQADAAGGLRRGQIVITGTFTGALPIGGAVRLEGRFAGLPAVTAALVEARTELRKEQRSCR